MTIYGIDKQIEEILNGSVNPETGEVEFDDSLLEDLLMEREQKIRNCALHIKEDRAKLAGLKATREEILKPIDEEIERKKKNIEHWEKWLEELHPDPFKDDLVEIKYRTTKNVVKIEDGFEEWAIENAPQFLRTKVEPDKVAMKAAMMNGEEISFAWLGENTSMSIK